MDDSGEKLIRKNFSPSSDQKTQIYSSTSSDQFLIIGLIGEIIGWKWQDILNANAGQMPPSAWKISIPVAKYLYFRYVQLPKKVLNSLHLIIELEIIFVK